MPRVTVPPASTTLATRFTIIIATHNMQQAPRISDYTAFFMTDKATRDIFINPTDKRTEDYFSGRFG